MPNSTKQISNWMGKFGREYTDRNPPSLKAMELLYKSQFGITRTLLNQKFLGELDRSTRILEIGSNIGIQLQLLQKMGFKHLYGIDLQSYAIKVSKKRSKNISILQGSIFAIPFKDVFFDLVFTSGVLIHIHPSDIAEALAQIHRCTKNYIWGFEYFAEGYEEVIYRGQTNLLWRTDYSKLYLTQFNNLEIVREERIKYKSSANVDSMFLLRKR